MKLYTSLFLFCTLFLSQIFSVSAIPINANGLRKRETYSFSELNTFIYFKKPANWGNEINVYLYEGEENNEWPGEPMKYNSKEKYYYFPIENQYFFNEKLNLRVIFNDGKNQVPGAMKEGFPVTMDGVYDETGIIGVTTKKANPVKLTGVKEFKYGNIARILYRPQENFFEGKTIYAHYKVGNGEWNSIPGDSLLGYWSGFYIIDIDLQNADDLTITFTNGEKWDNNNKNDYKFKKFSNTLIDKNNGNDYNHY